MSKELSTDDLIAIGNLARKKAVEPVSLTDNVSQQIVITVDYQGFEYLVDIDKTNDDPNEWSVGHINPK